MDLGFAGGKPDRTSHPFRQAVLPERDPFSLCLSLNEEVFPVENHGIRIVPDINPEKGLSTTVLLLESINIIQSVQLVRDPIDEPVIGWISVKKEVGLSIGTFSLDPCPPLPSLDQR